MNKRKTALIFARVSTSDKGQDAERQVMELNIKAEGFGYDVKHVITETISGTRRNEARPQLLKAISLASQYDIFMVTELSRLGRSPVDVLKAVDELHEAGVNIYLAQHNLWTRQENGDDNPMAFMFLQMLSAFAKLEADTIRARIKSGIAHAKAKGVVFGRPKGSGVLTDNQYLKKHKSIVELAYAGVSISKIMDYTGRDKRTILKVKRIVKNEVANN